jgi:signal transduction histidine kinase
VKSLRARVAVVVVLAFVPAFVVVYIVARNDRSEAREDSADETRELASNVATQYETLLGDTRTLLRAIGSVAPNDIILAQCDSALAAIVRQSPVYDNLVVLDDDRSVICSARPASRAVDRTNSDWFATTLADGDFVGLAEGVAGSAGTFTIAVGLGEPNTGDVVAAQIALDGLASVVGSAQSPSHASVMVVDGSDTVLFQRPAPEQTGRTLRDFSALDALRGRDGGAVVVTKGPDGTRQIYTGEQLSEPAGAVVIAGVPTDVAYDEPERWFRVRVVVLVVATLAALAIALAFAHLSVIRRIRQLVAMTRRIGAGDLSARSNSKQGDEIGELGRSLDSMAEELRARELERAHLLGAVVEASEEERRRIAGDVHDDSIQVMSAHVMNLQLLRRRVDDPELQTRIRELEESGRAATSRLRDLVFELHSPTLEEHGLQAALETLLDRAFEGEDVAHSVASSLQEEPPHAAGAIAYRIAQEAIRNARQHAGPHHVTVELRRDGGELEIRITDDGSGFEAERVDDRPGHLGLRGIRERAAAVGGSVTIDSAPARGTTVRCRLPWLIDQVP